MNSLDEIVAEAAKDADDFRHVISYREAYRRTASFNLLPTGEYHETPRYAVSSEDTTIDIVVPIFNALDYATQCLQRLMDGSLPGHSRIVIVDDGSDHNTSDFLRSLEGPSVKYHRNATRLGFTRSVDNAIRSSFADFVAIINSDAIPTEGWLHRLVACLSANPEIAMVGPLSNSAAWQSVGRILGANGRFTPRWPEDIYADDVSDFLKHNHANLFVPMDILHGFCFLLRRTAYCDVGGLDLASFPVGYGETQDLSFRLRAQGYRIGVCPSSYVHHQGTRSFTPNEKSMYGRHARKKLYEIHGAKTYLEAETKCLLNPDLTTIRSGIYGWFDIPQTDRNHFIPASLTTATLLRIEKTWRQRRTGIISHVSCHGVQVGEKYRLVTMSDNMSQARNPETQRISAPKTHPAFASHFACRRLEAFPPFEPGRYLARNLDVAKRGLDAAMHFLAYGSREHRVAFDKKVVSREMGKLNICETADVRISGAGHARSLKDVGIYCSSSGNLFMKVIAERLCNELNTRGVRTTLLDETASVDRRPDHCIFVAPHEFFRIGEGRKWEREDVVASAVMLNTEQVQETWFHMACPYLFNAAGIIDICYQNAQLFSKSGVPSLFWMPPLLAPGTHEIDTNIKHPLAETLPRDHIARPNTTLFERPLDLTFFGAATPHRERFFARSARWSAQYYNMIYLRRARGALDSKNFGQETLEITKAATASSKISLNVHRNEVGYFEWHRIVDIGMASGAVVVSENCLRNPVFKDGTHYISENLRFFPDLIDWLLKEKDGRTKLEEVRSAVAEIANVGTTHTLSDNLVEFIGQIHTRQQRQWK